VFVGDAPILNRQTTGGLNVKKSFLLMILTLGLTIAMFGCKSAPTEEINVTNAAVKSIETPDVNTYAPESLKAAQDEMQKALAEVKVQDEKFALTRDYQQSVALLKSANELAEKAKSEAEANKAKAKADAEAATAELPQTLKDASDMLAKAPKGKDTRADLEAMQNDLKLAEESAAEANTAVASGNYIDALAKANTAKEKASSIVDQVQSARQKLGRRN
jgi:hypothetical protein